MIDSIDLERMMLASVMYDANINSLSGLADQMLTYCDSEMFTLGKNRDVFCAIKICRDNMISPDIVNVAQNLQNAENIVHVSRIDSEAAKTTNIDHLIESMRLVKNARELGTTLSSAIRVLDNCKTMGNLRADFDEVERLVTQSFSGGKFDDSGNSGDISDFMPAYFENKELAATGKVELGIPTGIPTYDGMTGGMRAGELYIIAGLPGMGKSTFLLSVIAHQILQGYSPILFSMEMDDTEIIDKLMSIMSFMMPNIANINYNQIRNPQYLNSKDFASMGQIAKIIKDSGAYLNIDPSINIQQIKTESRRLNAERKLGVVGVDYLQLMIRDENKVKEELSAYTKELKMLGKELEKPVAALVSA